MPDGKQYTFKPETLATCMKVPVSQIVDFCPIYPELLKLIDPQALNFGIWVKSTTHVLEYINAALSTEAKRDRLKELPSAVSKVQSITGIYVQVQDRDRFFSLIEKSRKTFFENSPVFKSHPESAKTYMNLCDCSAKIMSYLDAKNVEYATQVASDIVLKISTLDDMLEMLTDIFEFNDELYDHISFVTLISATIAKRLGVSDSHLKTIALGCLYHDIGIPRLDLPDFYTHRLPPKLMRDYERHPTVGVEYLSEVEAKQQISLPEDVFKIIHQHHELYNGSGFPDGKKGRLSKENPNGIHVLALIVSLADKFSLMSEAKENKTKLDVRAALASINRLEGEFDPVILKVFNDMMGHIKNEVQVGKAKYTF